MTSSEGACNGLPTSLKPRSCNPSSCTVQGCGGSQAGRPLQPTASSKLPLPLPSRLVNGVNPQSGLNNSSSSSLVRASSPPVPQAPQIKKLPIPQLQLLDRWTWLLLGVVALHFLSIALMVWAPNSQGLLVYCHWVRVPIGRDLRNLVSFRLPHGRNIEIHTSDGVSLKGWHILPAQQAAEASGMGMGTPERDSFFDQALARPGERVIVYFHGNAATRGQWNRVELMKAASSMLNAHVIAVDYRGFADSTGWPSEEGLLLDAKAIWEWLEVRLTDDTHTYLYGQSLGTAVAIKLAHALGPTAQVPLTGMILDAPFTNLSTAALHHPSALPFRIIPLIKNLLLKALKEKYPSIDLIQAVTCPLFVLHGKKDGMIPFHVGQALYQAGRLARLDMGRPDLLEDMWFGDFPEAGHNDIYAQPSWVGKMTLFMTTMERRKTKPTRTESRPAFCIKDGRGPEAAAGLAA